MDTEFVRRSLKLENNEQNEKLLKTLQFSSTALRQAIAYIISRNEEPNNLERPFRISDYVQRYENKRQELAYLEYSNEEAKIISATLGLSFDQIMKINNGDKAIEIVNIISYLASENIPIEMFHSLAQSDQELRYLIQILEKYSIIYINKKREVFSVDILVQEVVRSNLKNQEEKILEKALALFKEGKIFPGEVHHAKSLWNQAQKYDPLVKKFCMLPSLIIEVFYFVGDYQESITFGKDALEVLTRILGHDHTGTIQLKNNMALAMTYQGKYEEALKSLTECSESLKQNPQLIADYLSTRHNIAFILSSEGKFEEALQIFQEVYEKRKNILGLKDSNTLITKGHVALLKFKLDPSSCNDSLRVMSEIVMELRDKGDHHNQEILCFEHNLGCMLNQIMKVDEALKLLEEVHEKRIKILGPDHPLTLRTHFEIANIYLNKEDCEKALAIYKEVYKKQVKILGCNHHESKITHFHIQMTEELSYEGGSTDKSDTVSKGDYITRKLNNSIRLGKVDSVNNILSKGGVDITRVTANKGNTPLHIATLKGNNRIVELILEYAKKQIDPNKLNDFLDAQTTAGKNTSLHVAAEKGYIDITKSLLKHGAIYNLRNRDGKTPADLAKDKSILDLLKLIDELFEYTRNEDIELIKELKRRNLKRHQLVIITKTRNDQGHTLFIAKLIQMNKRKLISDELSKMVQNMSLQTE